MVFGVDKFRAKRNRYARNRIPESHLLGLAAVGGSVGALLGMICWHHKTRHHSFYLGVPIILIAQIAVAVWFFVD